jgi:hypothetical protein
LKDCPDRYIDTDLIEENWDDILRLIATIKLKEVSASELFRRLNAYSKQHALYRALKAFGKIIKSLFILRYIDDVELRQAIERQLNKIEHVHRFTRAVSVGSPQEFIPVEKQEQETAEGCKRLIKNCITCWNYLYLSQKLAETEVQTAEKRCCRLSPTAQSLPGDISTSSVNMISQRKNCRIWWELNPQNGPPKWMRSLGVQAGPHPSTHQQFMKNPMSRFVPLLE